MTEVSPKYRHCCNFLHFEQNVASTAAEIEHTARRFFQSRRQTLYELLSPQAVDIEGEQMIEEVVPGGNVCKHLLHPLRGLLFVAGPRRSGAGRGIH